MDLLTERLLETLRVAHAETGQKSCMVSIDSEYGKCSCEIEFDPYVGLLVDGRHPSVQWYQSVVDFEVEKPQLLH